MEFPPFHFPSPTDNPDDNKQIKAMTTMKKLGKNHFFPSFRIRIPACQTANRRLILRGTGNPSLQTES
jgi:hypothetical protein